MKKSVRALRMERHHKRMGNTSKLSLVSLMDIFTILVFFLMFNASDVQVLQTHKSVTLPESRTEQAAEETLVLMVNDADILLQGQVLADVERVLAQQELLIPALQQALEKHKAASQWGADQVQTPTDAGALFSKAPEGAITIMGDKDIPYLLLKKIMQTCAQAGFTQISLAVEQVSGAIAEQEAS